MATKDRFARNPDIDLLVTKFRDVKDDDPFLYDADIAKTIGRSLDDRHKWWYMVQSAVDKLERADGVLFIRPRGLGGYKKAGDREVVDTMMDGAERIRRMANRRMRRAQIVNRDGLDDAGRRQFDLSSSLLAVISHTTKQTTVKKIEAAVGERKARLAIGSVLDVVK